MRIVNGTKWSTEDLRTMFGQALVDHGVPSQKLRVIVTYARSGIASGTADPGKYKANFVRTAGANLVRAGAKIEYGEAVRLRIPNPPKGFDPESDEHVELVIEVARMFDACAIILAAGTPSSGWREKPIAWLSDWFEVYRGEKGRAIGSRASPLLPAPLKPINYEAMLERQRLALKRIRTRIKRLETGAKKRERKIAMLERKCTQ